MVGGSPSGSGAGESTAFRAKNERKPAFFSGTLAFRVLDMLRHDLVRSGSGVRFDLRGLLSPLAH